MADHLGEEDFESLGEEDYDSMGHLTEGDASGSIRKKPRKMTEAQKVERRERNREHAKRSRVRKKVMVDTLQDKVRLLQEENERLREVIRINLPNDCDRLLAEVGILTDADSFGLGTHVIDVDQAISETVRAPNQAFLLTDPSLPDNPIVYVSDGFVELTGFDRVQLLGRNCRLMQGPGTEPEAKLIMREAIQAEVPVTVCVLNYKADGSPFHSQVALSPVRDETGRLMHFMGVQHQVSAEFSRSFMYNLMKMRGHE